MGLDDSQHQPDRIDPEEEPQSLKLIETITDEIIITRTTHGPCNDEKDAPRWMKYHVSDQGENPTSPDDVNDIKSTDVFTEGSENHSNLYFYIRGYAVAYHELVKQD